MKKNTIEITITATLIVVLIFSVSNLFKSRKRRSVSRSARVIALKTQQEAIAVVTPGDILKNLEDKAKGLKWGRDPFAYRSAGVIETEGDLKLDGIVWDDESPKAMINGIIMGIGERIGDYTILDITKDSVLLTDGTSEIKLRL